MTYWKAFVMKPPWQPLFPYLEEQSTKFWGLRDFTWPVVLFSCPSSAPAALNAQHEPHEPWEEEITLNYEYEIWA